MGIDQKQILKKQLREVRERRMAITKNNCHKCGGRGYIICPKCYHGVVSTYSGVSNIYAYPMGVWEDCSYCNGDGWIKCDRECW